MFNIEIKSLFVGVSDTMFDWRVTLTRDGRKHEFDYHAGFAHCKRAKLGLAGAIKIDASNKQLVRALVPHGRVTVSDVEGYIVPTAPSLQDVLQCLQSDARSGEHMLFEDFASDFGYDTDSRKAEKIWRACQETRGRLMKFLGNDFQNFMDHDFDASNH